MELVVFKVKANSEHLLGILPISLRPVEYSSYILEICPVAELAATCHQFLFSAAAYCQFLYASASVQVSQDMSLSVAMPLQSLGNVAYEIIH